MDHMNHCRIWISLNKPKTLAHHRDGPGGTKQDYGKNNEIKDSPLVD